MPGADIGPAARNRHHRGPRSLFHDSIIDRDRLRRSESGLVELDEAEVGARLRHRVAHGLDAFRVDLAIFIRQYGGAEHEIAAVPEIAGLDISRSRCRVRLLDKLRDRADLAGNNLAGIDVAIFGSGAFGLHTEGHDVPGFRGSQSLTAGGKESRRVAHHVIGGQRQHDRILVARLREGGAGCDGGTGIAPHRLQQHVGRQARSPPIAPAP
jgi:hypothetical protein